MSHASYQHIPSILGCRWELTGIYQFNLAKNCGIHAISVQNSLKSSIPIWAFFLTPHVIASSSCPIGLSIWKYSQQLQIEMLLLSLLPPRKLLVAQGPDFQLNQRQNWGVSNSVHPVAVLTPKGKEVPKRTSGHQRNHGFRQAHTLLFSIPPTSPLPPPNQVRDSCLAPTLTLLST